MRIAIFGDVCGAAFIANRLRPAAATQIPNVWPDFMRLRWGKASARSRQMRYVAGLACAAPSRSHRSTTVL